MELKTIISQLATTAKSHGLCQPWQERFKHATSLTHLRQMYREGIDFCVKTSYPSLGVLRKIAGAPYGIFVDEQDLHLINAENIIFNGRSRATLVYDGYSATTLYLRHQSHADISVQDNAILFVNAYEASRLNIKATGRSQITVFRHQQASLKILHQDPSTKINIKTCKTI